MASLLIRSGHLDLPAVGIAAAGGVYLREHIETFPSAFNDKLFVAVVAKDKHRGVDLAVGTLSGFG
jgi:hypothetical protein